VRYIAGNVVFHAEWRPRCLENAQSLQSICGEFRECPFKCFWWVWIIFIFVAWLVWNGYVVMTLKCSESRVCAPRILPSLSIEGVGEYIKQKQPANIIVMTGAGISTSAGVPDFRSPGIQIHYSWFNLLIMWSVGSLVSFSAWLALHSRVGPVR